MTSYVTFCYLDAGTGVPASVQPQMLNGQRAPNGVTWGFSLESRWPIGSNDAPFDICYGTTNGKTDFPGILSVITKAEYDAAKSAEMSLRQRKAIDGYRLAIQAHVDAVAISRRYDSGVSMASYVASTDPAWAAEAKAFVEWRDAVWKLVYAKLDEVTGGSAEQPTVETLIASLPAFEPAAAA